MLPSQSPSLPSLLGTDAFLVTAIVGARAFGFNGSPRLRGRIDRPGAGRGAAGGQQPAVQEAEGDHPGGVRPGEAGDDRHREARGRLTIGGGGATGRPRSTGGGRDAPRQIITGGGLGFSRHTRLYPTMKLTRRSTQWPQKPHSVVSGLAIPHIKPGKHADGALRR